MKKTSIKKAHLVLNSNQLGVDGVVVIVISRYFYEINFKDINE